MASRTLSVMAYPTEYRTDQPRFASSVVILSNSSCQAPAPSADQQPALVRCGDLRAIAAIRTST
jgi:hypothetical protein